MPANGDGFGGQPWEVALLALLHPLQVAIVEAHLWIDQPLSPATLVKVFNQEFTLNTVSYHVRRLAQGDVLRQVFTREHHGANEHFYRVETDAPGEVKPRCAGST